MRSVIILTIFLLLCSVGFAWPVDAGDEVFIDHDLFLKDGLTYSRVPRTELPLLNIYDPATHENEDITEYSFEELDALLGVPQFLRWNDEAKVCESMVLMFGRPSFRCSEQSLAGLTPATARAYVSFVIVAPPTPIYGGGKMMVLTDPLTPPWAPTYQPYHPYDPYW